MKLDEKLVEESYENIQTQIKEQTKDFEEEKSSWQTKTEAVQVT